MVSGADEAITLSERRSDTIISILGQNPIHAGRGARWMGSTRLKIELVLGTEMGVGGEGELERET